MNGVNVNPVFADLNNAKTLKNGVLEVVKETKTNEVRASDLIKRGITEIPCLVKPIFQKIGLAALAGSSDTGKSTMLRQLAIDIVTGADNFIGFPIDSENRKVIYVSTEDDEMSISYLLHKVNEHRKIPPDKFEGLRFVFETPDLLNQLDLSLTKEKADLVIIDAFTDLYGKSMNESNQMRTFLNDYSQLAQKHKCLVLFLHHTGKRTEREAPSKHHLLGSQAFEAKMRLVLELRSDQTNPYTKHLCIVKGNYLPSEYKKESYVLKFGDDMIFENTGERTGFEFLVKTSSHNQRKEKYELAKELKEKGFNYEQIAKELGYKGKSSISKLFKEFSEVSKETNGNEQET